MPYRTNAPELRDAEQKEDERELEYLASEATRRRRRAKIAASAFVIAGVALFLGPSVLGRRAKTWHCHRVERRWENAPHIPPETWDACEWR